MPDDRQQDPGTNPAAPSPQGGRRRVRHLDDAVLDQLLETEPEQALVGDVTLHVTECGACRTTLEEWTTLFPQLDVVLPRIPRAQAGAGLHPPAPRVVIPDNEPPRRPRQTHRLAWGMVVVLLAAVVVLAWQLFLRPEPAPKTAVAVTPVAPTPIAATVPPPADSSSDSALGTVILTSPAVVVNTAAAPTDTAGPQASPGREDGLAAGVTEAREPRPTPPRAAPVKPEPEPEAPPARQPASFPRKAPVETRPVQSGARESSPTDMANLAPTFRRIELGDGIEALGGTIRTLSGLTPEEVYIAPGRIVPGAREDRPLVRLAYRTSSGDRLILDQQRLDASSDSPEASIAVSTSASGVTVAQWIDREGFSISLAGHMDQDELLRYANQLQ